MEVWEVPLSTIGCQIAQVAEHHYGGGVEGSSPSLVIIIL